MADGVDHIDIYADVEEEFSQVKPSIFSTNENERLICFSNLVCFALEENSWAFGSFKWHLLHTAFACITSPFTMLPADMFSASS